MFLRAVMREVALTLLYTDVWVLKAHTSLLQLVALRSRPPSRGPGRKGEEGNPESG